MSRPQITAQSWLMIAILGFVWGATFLVTEIALTGMTPFWIAAARITFAALVMGLIWRARRFSLFNHPPPRATRTSVLLIAGMSTMVPFCLLAWGQQYVTSGFAGVSMAAVPLMVVPLAHFLVPGEAMHLRRAIGFCIGFVGVVILIGPQAFASTGSDLEALGRLACVGAAACYTLSSVAMRRLPPVDPIGLSALLLILAVPMILPLALLVEGVPQIPSGQILLVLAFLGLVPTAAANLLRVLVVRSAGPVFMSLVNYQVPVWSVVLGAWVLAEPLPPALLSAMALILTGVAISQWGALMRLFKRST